MKVKIGPWYIHRYISDGKVSLWTSLEKAQVFSKSQLDEYMPVFEEIAKVGNCLVEIINIEDQPVGQLNLFT